MVPPPHDVYSAKPAILPLVGQEPHSPTRLRLFPLSILSHSSPLFLFLILPTGRHLSLTSPFPLSPPRTPSSQPPLPQQACGAHLGRVCLIGRRVGGCGRKIPTVAPLKPRTFGVVFGGWHSPFDAIMVCRLRLRSPTKTARASVFVRGQRPIAFEPEVGLDWARPNQGSTCQHPVLAAPGHRQPTTAEITACLPFVERHNRTVAPMFSVLGRGDGGQDPCSTPPNDHQSFTRAVVRVFGPGAGRPLSSSNTNTGGIPSPLALCSSLPLFAANTRTTARYLLILRWGVEHGLGRRPPHQHQNPRGPPASICRSTKGRAGR